MKNIFRKSQENTGNKPGQVNESAEGIKYQCPMKCEGDKVYDEPGRCPVCKMYLAPVTKS
jgi:protein SCO1